MSSTNASNSSSTAITPVWSYDVFLSFRGEDTRKGFVDHLYTTLYEKGIHTFKDDTELKRGSSISTKLEKAIESSEVALVIFSANYANSTWCLDEIVKIVECNQKFGQKIYPVFYDVDPSDEKIESWRNALKEAANVSGWEIKHLADGHESKGIREIALDILNNLSHNVSQVKESLIGVESHVEQVMSLLNLESTGDVRMIGIWGMGGIGKTAIVRAVFDQIFSKFEGSSYLDNVREVSKTLGLNSLEEKLLSDTLMEKSANLHNNTSILFRRLRHKRVLVVLDDVSELEHLDRLAGGHDWFGAGSRIIITTRDRQLISSRGIDDVYAVSVLGTDVALKLFSKFAFKGGVLKDEFKNLACTAVRYARGLPLALKVLGSSLHGRDIDNWKITLDGLKEIPEDKILEKLKVSFDALNDMEKKIFLDIACFFKGKKKENVMRKLDGLGPQAKIGVSDLIQKSLINVTTDNRFQMHNLLQELGWYIVRRPHPNEPGRHSRLWLPEEISIVLTKNVGTEDIEGIHVDYSDPKSMEICSKAFTNMKNLRILKIHNACIEQMPDSIPSDLQWLDLHKYQTRILPPSFQGEKLVGPWRTRKGTIENLGQVESLEELLVDGTAITQPPPSITLLTKLNVLSFSRCKRPKSRSSLFSGNLESSVSSISGMLPLQKLGLSSSNQTKCSLPPPRPSLTGLCSLKKLDLSSCDLLEELSADLASLSSLEELDLSGNNFVAFPAKISELPRLKILKLESCTRLESLPDLPKSIAVLDADDCYSLSLVDLSEKLAFLWKVSLFNCFKLVKNEENNNTADKLLHTLLQGQPVVDNRFSIIIPGRELPEWFSYQNMSHSVTIPLTPDWHKNVNGIAVSIVFERLVSKSKIGVVFKLISRDHEEFTANITPTATKLLENYGSAHVWIGYISFHLFQLLFPKFQLDDWAKIEGCLTISTMDEAWIKPRGCGIRFVYKEALAQYMETRPGIDQELNISKEAEESIDVLTFGVNQLNWSVDPVEEEGIQIQSLRSSTAFKVQKTLSFDY
ncbi:unnamed protein product [Fraxinus pennsylvanica]|uniref:ADP-ribosyl cyclase/cyclic ADP-ribose hydrolase n=1 Tax=Fraxinus pennsylvanica TaxID=56036 RepID=A0AAD1ZTL0_9LAMI|nr:unnamed protein product [Fraxinus pennsylvanica]